MYTAVLVIHLVVCIFLIFIILLQSSKGAEMGAAFGGSNQTLFGSRGAATFLSKLTTAAAVLFMITSLSLAIFSVKQNSIMSDVTVNKAAAKAAAENVAGPLTEKPAAPGQGETPAENTAPAEQQPASK